MLKYIEEFRSNIVAKHLASSISENSPGTKMNIMEVCGGHTIAILKYGLKELLPENIDLISGPGCPVCVTSVDYIDKAIFLSKKNNNIIATFGDMMRVPGSKSSLLNEKSQGADVRVVLSPVDSLKIAKKNPGKNIIFLGIGFETTAPIIASTILKAEKLGLKNFYMLTALKTMPTAMEALLKDSEVNVQAFICPGHVSTITGSSIYNFIAGDYNIPCVISGFEPVDILTSIDMIVKQVKNGVIEVSNEYSRAVKPIGNSLAREVMYRVFENSVSRWRGIGEIDNSGLQINDAFSDFDAEKVFEIVTEHFGENPLCICGDIMRGIKKPTDCKLFKNGCVPENPVGACMVSAEGTCSTYYKYS